MSATVHPAFSDLLRTFFKIGCLGFGGPAGQIALMHRILVDEKKWVEEQRFLHALNFCMLLPGPEAQQLATYTGWLMHGVRGGIAAGILFVLPGACVMLALSLIYALGQGLPLIDGALFGIKAAVLVIVVEALIRIGKRALKTRTLIAIAAAAFIGIFFFALPFPLIVIGAGLLGYLIARGAPELLAIKTDETYPPPVPGRWRQSAIATVVGLVLWWTPVALAALLLGPTHVLVDIGTFFSKLATVSFGGAYALLAYMAQEAVDKQGWMTAAEMVDGLGLAETTPGPLILVTQFVGFLAGYREAAPFSPVTAGVIAAAMTTWVTFSASMLWIFAGAPFVEQLRSNPMLTWVTFSASMLWIFAGAPFVEQLRSNRMLTGALAAITAAVVGVILNLTVWFALHVLFGDVTEQRTGILRWYAFDPLALDLKTAALAIIAALLAFRFHRGLVELVAVMAALGIAVRMVF